MLNGNFASAKDCIIVKNRPIVIPYFPREKINNCQFPFYPFKTISKASLGHILWFCEANRSAA